MTRQANHQQLSIGEAAGRLGISVRSLRLYEAEGLLTPIRTEAGRRVFGADDITRLRHILVLKKTGCTLAQIRAILASRSSDFSALIDARMIVLQQHRDVISRTLASLTAARARIEAGKPLGFDEFCDLVEQGEDAMTENAWKEIYDRYYTPEDLQRWQSAKTQVSPSEMAETQIAWSTLIARVEAAMKAGASPDGHEATSLACEWYDLQKPLFDKVGAETWNKAAGMYGEMEKWQTETVRAPFSSQVYRFISLAADAARARGMIPPRTNATA